LASADKPKYTQLRKGRWYWEPPLRLRKANGLNVKALGSDQAEAWAYASKLNAELDGLDPGAAVPGTVAWLFGEFFKSDRFASLAKSTQGDYRWLAKRLGALLTGERSVGQLSCRVIRARHADALHAILLKESGHSAAHYACRFARRVWKWAARKEFVDPMMPNPWASMELSGISQREQYWSPAQVETFKAAAVENCRPSLGLAVSLAYWLGHRQGDVLTLTWTSLDAGWRKTNKTKARAVLVPKAYPELEVEIIAERARQAASSTPSTHVVVCEMTGRPWQEDTFRHEFRRIATIAGIPADLQFRDLRATAATELADAGADVIDLSTHTTHKTAEMARRYARRTPEQFQRAAAKRLAARNKPKTDDGTGDGTDGTEEAVGK
jgi:integrase